MLWGPGGVKSTLALKFAAEQAERGCGWLRLVFRLSASWLNHVAFFRTRYVYVVEPSGPGTSTRESPYTAVVILVVNCPLFCANLAQMQFGEFFTTATLSI